MCMSAQTSEATVTRRSPKYRLRVEEFDRLTIAKGWYTDVARARAIGVSHTTVGRMRKPNATAGDPFIRATLAKLEVEFDTLFFERQPA